MAAAAAAKKPPPAAARDGQQDTTTTSKCNGRAVQPVGSSSRKRKAKSPPSAEEEEGPLEAKQRPRRAAFAAAAVALADPTKRAELEALFDMDEDYIDGKQQDSLVQGAAAVLDDEETESVEEESSGYTTHSHVRKFYSSVIKKLTAIWSRAERAKKQEHTTRAPAKPERSVTRRWRLPKLLWPSSKRVISANLR